MIIREIPCIGGCTFFVSLSPPFLLLQFGTLVSDMLITILQEVSWAHWVILLGPFSFLILVLSSFQAGLPACLVS
jgi:hypothetical protein